jgi:hypothetical protein
MAEAVVVVVCDPGFAALGFPRSSSRVTFEGLADGEGDGEGDGLGDGAGLGVGDGAGAGAGVSSAAITIEGNIKSVIVIAKIIPILKHDLFLINMKPSLICKRLPQPVTHKARNPKQFVLFGSQVNNRDFYKSFGAQTVLARQTSLKGI